MTGRIFGMLAPATANDDVATLMLFVTAAVLLLLGGYVAQAEGRPAWPPSDGWLMAAFFWSDALLYAVLARAVAISAEPIEAWAVALVCAPGLWAAALFLAWAKGDGGKP